MDSQFKFEEYNANAITDKSKKTVSIEWTVRIENMKMILEILKANQGRNLLVGQFSVPKHPLGQVSLRVHISLRHHVHHAHGMGVSLSRSRSTWTDFIEFLLETHEKPPNLVDSFPCHVLLQNSEGMRNLFAKCRDPSSGPKGFQIICCMSREDLERASEELFPNGSFSMQLRILLDSKTEGAGVPHSRVTAMASDSKNWKLPCACHSILKKMPCADVTITCGTQEFKVHRAVLDGRSSILQEILKGIENTDAGRVLEVDGRNPQLFSEVIQYMYTGKLKFTAIPAELEDIMAYASIYNIEGLKEYCMDIMGKNVNDSNAAEFLATGFQYDPYSSGTKKLKEYCARRHNALLAQPKYQQLLKEKIELFA